ncbi:MAG: Rpn family recombination-promoting nuclease/putative transposase [Bacteroidia bacterium]|nr:Rpn family recombination-promoting nuclease/putative transposase [Bacteroidia bacterium]
MHKKHNRPEVSEGQTGSPHDRFFKRTLKDQEKAIGTLEGVLPPEVFARLRLETFVHADTSYVDPRLREYFSDLVYTCLTKDEHPVNIAFLFEHKSYPVDYPHLQILRYMLEIWDRQVREKQPLSLIIPVLLYHGKEVWEYKPFHYFFPGERAGLERYLPLFDFQTINLQAVSLEAIGRQFRLPALRIAFRLMKSIRDEDLGEKITLIMEGLEEIRKLASGHTFFETVFVYLLQGSKTDVKEIMKNMYNLIPEEWVEMYDDSPAMQLIRRGREEVWAEAEAKVASAMKKEALAWKKEAEARQKAETEAKEKIKALKKEAEARQKAETEAKEKAEALRKIESEKKVTIAKMLHAGIEKAAIAEFLGLSRQKLAAYIRQIQKGIEE